MATMHTSRRARSAHGDAWQVLGRLHAEQGLGRVGQIAGGLLMASGLPHPQYNNVDVLDPTTVDIGQVEAWYESLGVPWGARVPAGTPWVHGRRLFRKRLMVLATDDLRAPQIDDRIQVRRAEVDELDLVVELDVAAFGGTVQEQRPWIAPLVRARDVVIAIAEWGGVPAGTGYAVLADGLAGPTVYVAGIGVRPEFRRRGLAAHMSAWLVEQAGSNRLAHLHPDTDSAARIYERLGFAEVDGLDIYIHGELAVAASAE